MKRTSDGHKIQYFDLFLLCQRNDVSLGNLRGAGKECDTLVSNLKEIWGLDKSRIDINCDSFIQSSDGTPDFTETFKQNKIQRLQKSKNQEAKKTQCFCYYSIV